MNCKRAKLLSALLLITFTAMSLYASGLKTVAPVVMRKPIMTVEYEYSKSGRITARKINGQVQNYKYDRKGQLLGVYDDKGNAIEEYVYDPAGNILKKTIHGRTTTYKYDKANQLVSSKCNGKVTKYEYDAAGRLVKEGDKEYHYIGLDKIESVTEGRQKLSSFTYHIDGQLAEAVTPEKRETFQWDGLALIQRNSTNYVNEPAVTGGNPILADNKVLFNDMLGTTLGVKDGDKVTQNSLTAFGESLSTSPMQDSFFTGKPHVGEMGYVFLFRAYRADQGKWQTSDPLGYPDGWNNFAYCSNKVITRFDRLGLCSWVDGHGGRIPIPLNEKHPQENTPEGYTYEPCDSETIIEDDATFLQPYYTNTVLVPCSNLEEDFVHLYIPPYEKDTKTEDFHYVYSYQCGQNLETHDGYRLVYVSMSVWLCRIIKDFECNRQEVTDYIFTNKSSYAYSETPGKVRICE